MQPLKSCAESSRCARHTPACARCPLAAAQTDQHGLFTLLTAVMRYQYVGPPVQCSAGAMIVPVPMTRAHPVEIAGTLPKASACTSTHCATSIVVMAMYWRGICHHTSVQPPAAHNLGLRPVLCSLLSVGCMGSRRNFGGSRAAQKNHALVPQLSFDQINKVERCVSRICIFPLFQNSLIFNSVALHDFYALGPCGLSEGR